MKQSSGVATKALILAAGKGTRLRPITDRTPKCLVPVHDRPLLEYWIEKLEAAGIQDALINTHHLRDQVVEFIHSMNARGSVQIRELYEPELLGSAGTVSATRSWFEGAQHCLIIYADNLSSIDLGEFLQFHQSHSDPFSMALFHSASPRSCGIAECDEVGRIIAFEEKPEHPTSDLANAGVYVLNADAFQEIAESNAFDLGHDVLPKFVGRMRGWTIDGYHRDIGTLDSLAAAHAESTRQNILAANPGAKAPSAAVFLDRDGTLIRHVHHLTSPDDVELLPGAAEAIAAFQQAGFKCIVVTNQSVIGRGLIDASGLTKVHDEINRQLAMHELKIDGWYHCPFAPQVTDPRVIEHFDRKPGPGMLFRAARQLNLEISSSWMIGDTVSDVLAGQNAGCYGSILLGGPELDTEELLADGTFEVSADLRAAAQLILDSMHKEPAAKSNQQEQQS
ncbi:HAD-IIIA family hydrolase [Aeoliella sp.]|uniref:HAD-IIIA family hydrolase n=1 Tax=Aeoliella sp. TaxID=2795800 RepID=UPI003CCC14FB